MMVDPDKTKIITVNIYIFLLWQIKDKRPVLKFYTFV